MNISLSCFLGGSDGKASACNARDLGLIPGSGRFPWRRKWQPTPVLLAGKFYGWRSLVGYSPQDHKESHTTEQLHTQKKDVLNIAQDILTHTHKK